MQRDIDNEHCSRLVLSLVQDMQCRCLSQLCDDIWENEIPTWYHSRSDEHYVSILERLAQDVKASAKDIVSTLTVVRPDNINEFNRLLAYARRTRRRIANLQVLMFYEECGCLHCAMQLRAFESEDNAYRSV